MARILSGAPVAEALTAEGVFSQSGGVLTADMEQLVELMESGAQWSDVGLPELVPGRFVSLKGLDSDLDLDYYIREVRHEIGSDGFSTTLEIGGWEE